MKKILLLLVLGVFIGTTSYADIFGGRETQKLKASKSGEAHKMSASASFVDAGTILDYLAAISGYLGVKEGFFYDIDEEEFVNYLAATVYTFPGTGIAINFGATGAHGIIASADWNVGGAIPVEDVPLISLFEYLYIGYGAGYRDIDGEDVELGDIESWSFSHGPTVVFKATF